MGVPRSSYYRDSRTVVDDTAQRAAVIAMLKTIFAQDTKAEAVAQWNTVADALRKRPPSTALRRATLIG
jgi:transposase-like protein